MRQFRFSHAMLFPFTLFVLMFVLSACSMQKSGSKMEAQMDKQAPPSESAQRKESSQERVSLTVDYLTPVTTIKRPEIFIYKEKRRLYVIQSNVLVRDYPVGLGSYPVGDKEQGGDGRTPEGDFFICAKDLSNLSPKSLGLSYPGRHHAERAFFAGLLTPVEFRDILVASEKRGVPPWNTRLGGAVSIHAGGAHRDWTDGSVALYESDMDELFQITSVGTPVTIRP